MEYTRKVISFTINKAKIYGKFKDKLNDRQLKTLKRIFIEGINGFIGGLSANNYISITKTSRATATRDLQKMVDIGVLYKKGELKNTRYYIQELS